MTLKHAHLYLFVLGTLLASTLNAHADGNVEINFETLEALQNTAPVQSSETIKLKKPASNNTLPSFNPGIFNQQPIAQQLQNIEPAAGTPVLKAKNLIPLPSKKPINLVAANAPIPPKLPKRGRANLKKAVLSSIGVKPQNPNKDVPPVPVQKVERQNLQPVALKTEEPKEPVPEKIKTKVEKERIRVGAVQRIFLSYPQNRTEVPDNIDAALSPDILAEIQLQSEKRIRIYAFATSEENSESEARRTALARALDLRKHLITNNIPSSRIDLHPMGLNDDPLKKDRVEIILEDPTSN